MARSKGKDETAKKVAEAVTEVAEEVIKITGKIAKYDYNDGKNRTYSIVVPLDIFMGLGHQDTVCGAIARLFKAAQKDKYWLYKFYTEFLPNDGGLSISGTGWPISSLLKKTRYTSEQLVLR